MKKAITFILLVFCSSFISCNSENRKESQGKESAVNEVVQENIQSPVSADTIEVGNVEKSPEEWKEILTAAEYEILREGGTEPAFRNEFYDNKREGIYSCGACGLAVYSSQTKFDSGTGWPSFWAPIDSKLVERKPDTRFGMTRTEVICAQCGSHFGHVFENNNVPSGERHCLNSLALDFEQKDI